MTHPTPSPTREEVEQCACDIMCSPMDRKHAVKASHLLRALLDRAEKAEAERDELAKWTAARKMEADGWRTEADKARHKLVKGCAEEACPYLVEARSERDMLRRVIEDTAREIGCEPDNELMLEEIANLKAERDALRKERDAALTRIKELEAALKPFAKAADDFGDHWLNCDEQWNEGSHGLDVGTLRRARAALASKD